MKDPYLEFNIEETKVEIFFEKSIRSGSLNKKS